MLQGADTDTLTYRIAFASLRGMGYDLAQKILSVIPTEKEYFDIPEKDLQALLQSKVKITERNYRLEQLDKARKEMEFVVNNNIHISYFSDEDYPTRLTNTMDAPILLYSKGNCNLNSSKLISIVGTRHATIYGKHFCETLIRDLKELVENFVIVSGLAYGIDICAHRAALSNGIPTVAVLAHGLNTIYPATHRKDAVEMVRGNGMLVTDYRSCDKIHPGNFVARNRIVAGLSDCTVVIESAEKGGSLITAGIASSYNRDVFALPGRANDIYSRGCNKLIRNNSASLITSAEELVSAMRWDTIKSPVAAKQMKMFADITPEEQPIVDYLRENNESHINVLCNTLGIPMSQLMNSLIELEFKGIVGSLPGAKYTLL